MNIHTISLPGLKTPRHVVMLSDMHLGPVLRLAFCKEVIAKVKALEPYDALVIVGDLVDSAYGNIQDLIPKVSVIPWSSFLSPFQKPSAWPR